jgi:hypothetical protein
MEDKMEYDRDKVDDMVLALLYLTTWKEKDFGYRTWKGYDWGTLDRLHKKGLISNPRGKARSVALSDEAARRSEELFRQLFQKD